MRKDSRDRLSAGVEVLGAVLEPYGFRFVHDTAGTSSGGAFANGYFVGHGLRIGLIVRGERLGAVVYEVGGYEAEHSEVLRELGLGDRATVTFDSESLSSRAIGHQDVFLALSNDLSELFLPTWQRSPKEVRTAIRQLREKWLESLLGHRPPANSLGGCIGRGLASVLITRRSARRPRR